MSTAWFLPPVGVPFQPITSPSVSSQRQFSGPGWYAADAVLAVNQALGRCIRHRDDYGAMVLLDQRFDGSGLHESNMSNAVEVVPQCTYILR